MKKILIQIICCILYLLIITIVGIKIDFVSYYVGMFALAIVFIVGQLV